MVGAHVFTCGSFHRLHAFSASSDTFCRLLFICCVHPVVYPWHEQQRRKMAASLLRIGRLGSIKVIKRRSLFDVFKLSAVCLFIYSQVEANSKYNLWLSCGTRRI